MDYTVIKTNDQWGYELRDSAGRYAGNAYTLEQLQRFALAEGAILRFEPAVDRRRRAGAQGWTNRLRTLAGLRLAPDVAAS